MALEIAIAIMLPVVVAVFFPDKAEWGLTWMIRFKRYVIGTVSLVFAALFLLTGNLYLALIGGLMIAYAVWFVIFKSDIEVI